MMAVVGLVLLIAGANVANLLLARATARQKEIAVRLAIGAGRGRLIRQLLTESILLAIIAGSLGLLMASWGGHLLWTLVSSQPTPISPDGRILAFTAAVSILTGVIFGLVPAFRATRLDLSPGLKENTRGLIGSSRHSGGSRWGLGKTLVISQVALSLLLLIGAGLLVRSLQNLNKIDVGFNRENVLVAWVMPTLTGYEAPREINLYWRLLERMNAIPGVGSASLSRLLLFSGYWQRSVSIPEYTPHPNERMKASCNAVAPKFFETMGIPLLLGRDFSATDGANSPKVAVISEAMARQYFRGKSPIGKRFAFADREGANEVEIVGVAKDIKSSPRDEQRDRSPRAVYIPFPQAPPTQLGQAVLELRTAANSTDIAAALRHEVEAIDKNLPPLEIQTQGDVVEESLDKDRSLSRLVSFFGLLALLLASIGLYGTMSYSVSRRTNEIGIRMALGAERKHVLKMVLREGIILTLIGVGIGWAAGLALTRVIASQLYGVNATDPLTFVAVSLFLAGVALLANYLPARRATKVDPMVALRYE
jgi:predicted permease